jgi:predicted SprT family Zn-dependent metalloprotease
MLKRGELTYGVYQCKKCKGFTFHKITKKKIGEYHYTCIDCETEMTRTHT